MESCLKVGRRVGNLDVGKASFQIVYDAAMLANVLDPDFTRIPSDLKNWLFDLNAILSLAANTKEELSNARIGIANLYRVKIERSETPLQRAFFVGIKVEL